jgi:hypothetical protein
MRSEQQCVRNNDDNFIVAPQHSSSVFTRLEIYSSLSSIPHSLSASFSSSSGLQVVCLPYILHSMHTHVEAHPSIRLLSAAAASSIHWNTCKHNCRNNARRVIELEEQKRRTREANWSAQQKTFQWSSSSANSRMGIGSHRRMKVTASRVEEELDDDNNNVMIRG